MPGESVLWGRTERELSARKTARPREKEQQQVGWRTGRSELFFLQAEMHATGSQRGLDEGYSVAPPGSAGTPYNYVSY